MGYTHYWTRSRFVIDKRDWKVITADVATIVAKSTAPIALEFDDKRPARVDGDMICFNGVGDNGHETFVIPRAIPKEDWTPRYDGDDRKWTFCKTAQKPYDVTVTAILAYLDSCWPTLFTVSSDGEPADWAPGLALAAAALPERTIPAPRAIVN